MHCVVINLERAVQRRECVKREFEAQQLGFRFFKAKDLLDLTDEDWKHVNLDSNRFPFEKCWKHPRVAGPLACWISHRQVWKESIENGYDVVAVFEDDITFSDQIKLALFSIAQSDVNFDLIFLHNNNSHRKFTTFHKLENNIRLGIVRYWTLGTQGYVITRNAMTHLLNRFPLMINCIDELMHYQYMHGLDTLYLDPPVVFHGSRGWEGAIKILIYWKVLRD